MNRKPMAIAIATAVGWSATTLALAGPLGSGFTYQGQLKQANVPVDGSVNLVARLFDAETGGALLGTQSVNNAAVIDGLFSIELNGLGEFGVGAFTGAARWIEIEVNGSVLSPRQKLTAVPYALSLQPGATVDGSTPGGGMLRGVNSNSFADSVGLKGESTATSGVVFGVWGNARSPSGAGVLGTSDVSSGSNAGGVRGIAFGPTGVGVQGFAADATGVNYAVRGGTNSAQGYAGYFTGGRNYFEGNVGIGTLNPAQKLSVAGAVESTSGGFKFPDGTTQTTAAISPPTYWAVNGGNIYNTNAGLVGIGTNSPDRPLTIRGSGPSDQWISLKNNSGSTRWHLNHLNGGFNIAETAIADGRLFLRPGGNVGIGTTDPQAKLDVAGATRTQVLTITGGSDIAEPYNVGDVTPPIPGMVLSIDSTRVGELRVSRSAYDTAVAGIVSGANGVRVGLTLTQEGSIADGQHPVAMTGRVWCWCDADAGGAIRAGDLLTTSSTPGHAMKVNDRQRAGGATIGKAMSSLESGRGLVLVLVNLQ